MSTSKAVPLRGNDEITSLKQYPGEALMEAWYRMQEIRVNCPNTHTQNFILRKLYNGQNTWSKLFLDNLTSGCFTTCDPSFSTLVLVSLFGNPAKTKDRIKFQQLKNSL